MESLNIENELVENLKKAVDVFIEKSINKLDDNEIDKDALIEGLESIVNGMLEKLKNILEAERRSKPEDYGDDLSEKMEYFSSVVMKHFHARLAEALKE